MESSVQQQLIYVSTTTNAITRCILPMLSMTVQEIGGQKEARQKERLEEYEKQVVMQATVDPSHQPVSRAMLTKHNTDACAIVG